MPKFEIGHLVRSKTSGRVGKVTGYTPEGKYKIQWLIDLDKSAVFKCQECGHKFKSVAAAERATFGDEGCPGCGGTDIDLN